MNVAVADERLEGFRKAFEGAVRELVAGGGTCIVLIVSAPRREGGAGFDSSTLCPEALVFTMCAVAPGGDERMVVRLLREAERQVMAVPVNRAEAAEIPGSGVVQ